MIRVSQSLAKELDELKVFNPPGEIPYEVAFFRWADRFLCVNVPQRQADAAFREIESRPEGMVYEGNLSGEVIHDLLGIPDESIAYLVDFPDRRGMAKAVAELRQAQNFVTRETKWETPEEPPAPVEGVDPAPLAPAGSALLRELEEADLELDDVGNPIPHDLGEKDMGEHDGG